MFALLNESHPIKLPSSPTPGPLIVDTQPLIRRQFAQRFNSHPLQFFRSPPRRIEGVVLIPCHNRYVTITAVINLCCVEASALLYYTTGSNNSKEGVVVLSKNNWRSSVCTKRSTLPSSLVLGRHCLVSGVSTF